jgi:glucan phosphoethanolaminetransferase (alkaline phosphatase superfamily)
MIVTSVVVAGVIVKLVFPRFGMMRVQLDIGVIPGAMFWWAVTRLKRVVDAVVHNGLLMRLRLLVVLVLHYHSLQTKTRLRACA